MGTIELSRLETRLRELDVEIFSAYAGVVRIARDLMPRAYATFWEYTDHTLTHTHAVVTIIDHLCADSLLSSLSADELFILLSGAVLHDIGMVTDEPLQGADVEAARRGHDIAGAEKILWSPTLYGIPLKYASTISKVVRNHRSSNIVNDVTDEPLGLGVMIRLRLLCALVRAGDELHLTEDRAPEVILDNLKLSEESVRHFANCRAVSGIARQGPEDEIILIQATVKDALAEDGIHRVAEKVNAELERLTSIFCQEGVPAYRVELRLNRHFLVKHKSLLCVCGSLAGKTIQQVCEETGEETKNIEDSLRSLRGERLIREVAPNSEKYAPFPNDIEVFKQIAGQFLETPDAVVFLKSGYAAETVKSAVVPWLCREFSCGYTASELKTRTEVLQHSPSSLRLSILSSDVGRKPSVLSRRMLLDQLLLSGILRDIYIQPEIADGMDVGKVVAELGRHIAHRVGPFARIVGRAWTYRDVSIEEMGDRFIGPRNQELPDGMFPVRMTMEIEFPQEPKFLSLPHLQVAAREELAFLEIASPQLKSFAVNLGDQSLPLGGANSEAPLSMMFQFQPPRPALPPMEMPCRFVVDEERRACNVFVDESRAFNQDAFPMRMVITDLSKFPMCTMQPRNNCGPMSCEALLNQLKLNRILAAEGHCRLDVKDLKSGEVQSTSDFTSTKQEETDDDREYHRAIKILAALEKRVGRCIEPPPFPTGNQLKRIVELQDQLIGSDDATCMAVLREVGGSQSIEWTRFRITATDDDGQIVCDSYPDIHLGLPELQLQMADGSHDQQATEKIRRGGFTAQYWSTRSPRKIVEMFVAAIAEHNYWAPDWKIEPRGIMQSDIQYEITPIKQGIWGREQLIHLTVKPQPAHRRLLDMARDAIDKEDFETAQEHLVDCVVAEPTLVLAHYNLGMVLYWLRHLDKAERSINNALSLGGEDWAMKGFAISMIGLIDLHRGQLDKALISYEEALQTIPPFNLPTAIEMIEKKLPSNINAPAAHYAAGWLLSRAGLRERAKEHLGKFLGMSDTIHGQFRESATTLLREIDSQDQDVGGEEGQ